MEHASSTAVVAPTVTPMAPEAEQSSPMVNARPLLVAVYRQGGALTEKFLVQSQAVSIGSFGQVARMTVTASWAGRVFGNGT